MASLAGISISLLGPLRLEAHRQELVRLPRKAEAMIVYLAAQVGKPVSREKMASLLWDNGRSEQAQRSLRQALLVARRGLGPEGEEILSSRAGGLAIGCEAVDIDLLNFEMLIRGRQSEKLERGLQLYRDEFLADFPPISETFDEWKLAMRSRAAGLAAEALERLVVLQTEAGEAKAAIASARRLIELDPLREEGHRLLMQLYIAEGRRTEALRQFAACADILKRELSVSPDAKTMALMHNIARQEEETTAVTKSKAVALIIERETHRIGMASTASVLTNSRRIESVNQRRSTEIEKVSIAILPFHNLSKNPEHEQLAEVITEDIATGLFTAGITVIAGGATRIYRSSQLPLQEIARELAAEYLVEGSIRGESGLVRINVRLLRPSGEYLWSANYDRERSDLFSIQDKIVQHATAEICTAIQRCWEDNDG